MDAATREYYQNELVNQRRFMKKLHKRWKECLNQYHLEFDGIPGLPGTRTVRMSRIYPILRQIIASIAFNYPYIFINARPTAPFSDSLAILSEKLERAANEGVRIMKMKREVHQQIFDAIFCTIGWGKIGFRDKAISSTPPFVVSNAAEVDFSTYHRVNPFTVMIDRSLGQPQSVEYARYIAQDIVVPRQFVVGNDRYDTRLTKKIPAAGEGVDEDMLTSFEEVGDVESQDVVKKTLQNGQFVHLTEIHDRYERKIITFAAGVVEPIEEADHPFANVEEIIVPHPLTGEPTLIGTHPAPGWVLEEGTPFIDLRFDLDMDSYYPQAPIAYVADLEMLIVESVSRRRDILQRFKRILLAEESLKAQNASLEKDFKNAEDAGVVWINGLAQSTVKEADWGNVPSDQLGIESDARRYEEQSLHVRDIAQSGGSGKSATEVAVFAGQGALNREWMQDKISSVYERAVRGMFRMFRDSRYVPEEFIVNIAPEDQQASYMLMTQDDFDVDFLVEVDAESMQPLIEQLNTDNVILIYDRLKASPNANTLELDKMLIKSAFHRVPQKLLQGDGIPMDSQKLIQMELVMYIMRGQDPGVQKGENHRAHLAAQSPQAIQQMQEFAQLAPEVQKAVLNASRNHSQMHLQLMEQEVGGMAGGSMPSADGRMMAGKDSLMSQVQSSAQKYQQQATQDARRLTRQGQA